MHTDDVIEAALAPLRPITRRSVPVEGNWAPPPFPDRVVAGRPVAVICEDPGLSAIVVDREDGRVLHLDPDERPWPMNSSVDLFVASLWSYQRARHEADWAEVGGSDEALDEIAERLRAEIAGIDPPAMDERHAIWPVMVEEFSYGM